MAAPAVLNLQDTIAALRAAQQGNYDTLTQQEKDLATNEANQTAGLAAKKDAAFGQITNNAQTRGALFSGFTPDAQATYTSATYLPALANLQKAITESRTAIQGSRNSLDSNISSEALKQVEGSKTAFQQWQDAQDAAARAEAQHTGDHEFTAQQNALDRANTLKVAGINHANTTPKPLAPGYKLVQTPDIAGDHSSGGLNFFDKTGKPITAYTYLQGFTNGNVSTGDIAQLLARSHNEGDKQIISDINNGATTDYLIKKYPHVFGS